MGFRRREAAARSIVKRGMFYPLGWFSSNAVFATPAAPANLAATPGTGNIALTWDAATGATGYELRYSSNNTAWTGLGKAASPYTDSNAKNAIKTRGIVYYQVRALNASGPGAWSASVSVGLDILALSPIIWNRADGTLFQNIGGTTPATADLDPVGFITDDGGGGRNLTQATSSVKPKIRLNIQNGLPSIRYDGVNDELLDTSLSAYNAVHNGTGATILFVCKKTAADGTLSALTGNNSGTGAQIGHGFYMQSGNLGLTITNGVTSVINTTKAQAAGSAYQFGLRYKSSASPVFAVRINGGVDATASQLATPTASNTGRNFAQGGFADITSNFFGGEFHEECILPLRLDDTQMAALMTYGNVRWGLY